MCLQPTVSAGLLVLVACSTVLHSLTRISLLASGFGEDPGGPWYHHMLAHQAEPQPASSPVFPHLFPLLPRCVPRHTGAQVCPPSVLDDSLSTPLPPPPLTCQYGRCVACHQVLSHRAIAHHRAAAAKASTRVRASATSARFASYRAPPNYAGSVPSSRKSWPKRYA